MIKYNSLNVNYTKPYIWKRSTIDKLPKKGKPYGDYQKEIEDFKKLKEGATKEICENIKSQIEKANDRNELNRGLDQIFEFYGKSIIPSNDVDTQFLLTKTNKNTLNKKLQGWCKNLTFNIPEVISSTPFQDLVGKFVDVPAFVVLAGPSLTNNREKLRDVKGKALIIAVDTSLRPLLDIGVTPDIVIAHDANPNGCKFFLSKDHKFNKEDINFNDMKDEQLAMVYAAMVSDKDRLDFKYDTLGIFVNYCHPLTLLAFNGTSKRFYGVQDPGLPVYDTMASSTNYKMDKDKKLVPENKGRVIGGSSVGHVAAYIAVMLGCNPVSFLGLDLSYPGGQAYVEGASNNKKVRKNALIQMEDLGGNMVDTNLSMLSYKMVFEKSFPHILSQKPDLRIYNCTEDAKGNPAGILFVGAEPKSLEWVIKNKCVQDRKELINKYVRK